jgi:glucosamine kinase
MLLLADSGSTKTEWKLVDDAGRIQASLVSEGLNPYFFTEQEIARVLEDKILPRVADVRQVFFYGAGCGLAPKAEQVKRAIDRVIPTAYGASVAGDILAAARSLLQHHPGIACILGTGANSCVYSGEEITEGVPSLGYLFSDWGSGTVMSRDFLALLLQERLPSLIQRDFSVTYQLSRVQILEAVYNKPSANKFMASFTPFILKYDEEPEVRRVILDNFRNFFSYYVLRYEQARKTHTVSVVGSIAYHFRKYLLEAGQNCGIQIDKILQHPMEGLIHFHGLHAKEKASV